MFGILLLLRLIPCAGSFNLDVRNVVQHVRPDADMFGFAVAQHQERGTSWLLVGAPQAQTRQPRVQKGGAVFRCSAQVDNDCQEIAFDRTGSRLQPNDGNQEPIEEKSGQWFGAAVHSSGPNGVVVVLVGRDEWYTWPGSSEVKCLPI